MHGKPCPIGFAGQAPGGSCGRGRAHLGLCSLTVWSDYCWGKEVLSPLQKIHAGVAFLVSSLGCQLLGPVRLEKGGSRVRKEERWVQNIHSFIHSTNISLAQLPARPKAGCWNSQTNLVSLFLQRSTSVCRRWSCKQTHSDTLTGWCRVKESSRAVGPEEPPNQASGRTTTKNSCGRQRHSFFFPLSFQQILSIFCRQVWFWVLGIQELLCNAKDRP